MKQVRCIQVVTVQFACIWLVLVKEEIFYPVQIVADSMNCSIITSLLWQTESTAFSAVQFPGIVVEPLLTDGGSRRSSQYAGDHYTSIVALQIGQLQ